MHKRSLTDSRSVISSLKLKAEGKSLSRPNTAIALTRYNHGLFMSSDEAKSRTVSGSTTVKNSVILKRSVNHRSTKSLSQCQDEKLFSDFLSNIGVKAAAASTSSKKISLSRPQSGLFLKDSVDKNRKLPIGNTFTTIFQDRKTHQRLGLDLQTKSNYRIRVQNLGNYAKSTVAETKYQAMMAEYHELYLRCLANKKEPNLTNMIQSKKKTVHVEDDFRLFVKYDADVKGSLA